MGNDTVNWTDADHERKLTAIFDTVRKNRMEADYSACAGVECANCPIEKYANMEFNFGCGEFMRRYPMKYIEFVRKYNPQEPVVDWTQVAIDTPVMVRNYDNEKWEFRYFACYNPTRKLVYTWTNGLKSPDISNVYSWLEARLATPEEITEYDGT